MSMHIHVDMGSQLCIELRVSGPYNPDILDDMTNRVVAIIAGATSEAEVVEAGEDA